MLLLDDVPEEPQAATERTAASTAPAGTSHLMFTAGPLSWSLGYGGRLSDAQRDGIGSADITKRRAGS